MAGCLPYPNHHRGCPIPTRSPTETIPRHKAPWSNEMTGGLRLVHWELGVYVPSCLLLSWPFMVTFLSALRSSQLKCLLGLFTPLSPFSPPTPVPNPPTNLARLWAQDDWEPFHLQIKLPLSNWACGENCANLTRLSSSVCSIALDSTVFSKLFQTPEIYLNYLTCENKTAQERKLLSLSEWASESRVHCPRASLCSDFWLQTWPGNKEKKKLKCFKVGSSVSISSWA